MTPGLMPQQLCGLTCSGQSELGFCFCFQSGARANLHQPPLHGGSPNRSNLRAMRVQISLMEEAYLQGERIRLACRGKHGEKAEVSGSCLSSQVHWLMKPSCTPTLRAARLLNLTV